MTCEILKAKATDEKICLGPLTIARILPGQVGLASQNGHPVFLATGVHLVNDPLFVYHGSEPMIKPHIPLAGE